ncbi:MAG: dCTP deaminase [Parcubacteria group bacterium CG11_big_fil_rev_8_21_14_0_20_39_22]|nr:MAG: dCTP deaminase [Parcubacteria group bacterium CG11_big_fil_rev_8_21_14_0_20_39_22]
MFLSDQDIRRAIKKKDITLKPFKEERLQPASYDIALGNKFIVNDAHTTTFIDPANKIFPTTRTVHIKDGEGFVLHPGVSLLGYSKEFFGSDHYLIEVNGKSSLARIGLLVHNSAALVNPGHFLNIALELCNLNNVPIILRPGMAIAQLTFSPLSSGSEQNYKDTGRYSENNLVGYIPPRTIPSPKRKKK